VDAFLQCGPFSASDREGRVLLDAVSVSLQDGQCVALAGPSGGGKSTLLRHITALNAAFDVARSLDGRTYGGGNLPAWRARVSLLAQDAPMIPGSLRENLSFPFAQRAGRDRTFEEGRAASLMAQAGLESLPLEREVRTLSGGERHRLALVRGLLWDPMVLVADEPLAGLDPDAAATCLDLLLSFGRRTGHLVVCVLHDPKMNSRADRCLRLAGGHLTEG
jgi:putative ABC transport system ATP-binding protein